MREIKFRTWDNEKKEYYKPDYRAYEGEVYEIYMDMSGNIGRNVMEKGVWKYREHESLFPDRYIIEQYSGLKDKNGVEIYEGDRTPNGVVEFSFGCWNINGDRPLDMYQNLEVIGNIHKETTK